MKNFILILALLLTILPLSAQIGDLTQEEFQAKYRGYREYPDSIRIEFPDLGSFVVIRDKNIKNNDSLFSAIPSLISSIIKDVEQGIADTDIPHHISVSYLPNADRKILVTEVPSNTTEIISRDNNILQLVPSGWEINHSTNYNTIHIYAPDFENLKSLSEQNFSLVQKTMNAELATDLNRSSLSSRVVIQNNALLSNNHERTGVHDILAIHLGAGMGVVGNQFHPFTKGSLGISLRDRSNTYRHLIEFSAVTSFFTFKNKDGNVYSRASNFLDLSYNINLATGKKPASWFGFGAGVLTTKRHNFFTGKTARFFLNKSFGEFEITPTLYLSNDYKDKLFGLGVSYTF